MDSQVRAQIRAEHRMAVKHLGITAYAKLHDVTVAEMKAMIAEAGTPGAVRWSLVSDAVLRAAFEDFKSGREIATRFAARHGYSGFGFSSEVKERWPDEWAEATGEKRPDAARAYQIGRSLEYRVADKLRDIGYFVVRSPASKSKVDLTALRDGQILLIQCKRNGSLPKDEWDGLIVAARKAGGIPVLVENPYAGRTNWWELTGEKVPGTSGPKIPFPEPESIEFAWGPGAEESEADHA